MILPLLTAAVFLAHPSLVAADPVPFLSQRERNETRKGEKGKVDRETPDEVARRYGLVGELLVATGDRIVLDRGYGTIAPSGGPVHKAGERWRLASITKQVTAALAVKRLPFRGLTLDTPLAADADFRDPAFAMLTPRQALTHHTGLANPDDAPATGHGVPLFYARTSPDLRYCLSKPTVPGSAFAYNNCDYIVLSDLFISIGRESVWPAGMVMAPPGRRGVAGFIKGQPEPPFQLASYGVAGGLLGTVRAVFDFDRSLMTGKLLTVPQLTELWTPEGHGSYQALGQWVFPGKLAGCAAPKRIVQRDGEIYGVQARNYILPDDDLVVIVFTNRSADDFAIGEVWEGKGFAYDLLSAAVGCWEKG